MNDVPRWARGVIAILGFLLVATNGGQYFGIGAPAQQAATTAEKRGDWCVERLKEVEAKLDETQRKLEECWQGGPR